MPLLFFFKTKTENRKLSFKVSYRNFSPKAPGRTETEDLLRGEQLQGIQGGQVPQGNHGQP